MGEREKRTYQENLYNGKQMQRYRGQILGVWVRLFIVSCFFDQFWLSFFFDH